MFGNPKKCRENAKPWLEQARFAPMLIAVARFEGLAHSWLRLAEDLERTDALLQQLKIPQRKASSTSPQVCKEEVQLCQTLKGWPMRPKERARKCRSERR